MVARVHTGSLLGIDAYGVQVEVDFCTGLPGIDIVGLPETAVRESQVRVRSAIINSRFELQSRRYVVNLAPADRRKSGASFDLAIAVALLCQCGLCAPNRLEETLFVGELSLEGNLRPVRGLLAHLRTARRRGLRAAVIPDADALAAGLATGLKIHRARNLAEVVDFLNNARTLPVVSPNTQEERPDREAEADEDLRDVRGQETAKRALEVAAAGSHNVLLVGPPGTGKTMLARRLRGIMPPPSAEEALEIATIAGAAGLPVPAGRHGVGRPFRAPHHTVSDAGLIGGGVPIRPGEVTLAHLGVLFLDELPEFRRSAIEALRPTMESGLSALVRAQDRVIMPSRPLVLAAMNPCPCGYHGDRKRICRCSPDQIQRYQGRVSGPLLDRFDIHVALPPVRVSELKGASRGETTAMVAERVLKARARRERREAAERPGFGERRTSQSDRLRTCVKEEALGFLHRCIDRLGLSLRAHDKVLKVARSIADLEGAQWIETPHLAEAIQYRLLDRDPASEGVHGLPLPRQRSRQARTAG